VDDRQVTQALDRLSTALVPGHDVADLLAEVTASCRDVLDVDATGIMVLSRDGRLQLLAASTHDAAELELHQSQIDEGPCVDAARDVDPIAVSGDEGLRERWPRFGPSMIAQGFHSVHSAPLRWNATTLGAMALFRHAPRPFDEREDEAAGAFADLVARIVVGSASQDDADLDGLVETALGSRIVVEHAKGAIMETEGVSAGEAYELLLRRRTESRTTLTAMSQDVLQRLSR
jgi:GAF domain-containing protein